MPAAAFIGDNHKGTWLPNKAIAQKWMQYVTDTKDRHHPAACTQGREMDWPHADLDR